MASQPPQPNDPMHNPTDVPVPSPVDPDPGTPSDPDFDRNSPAKE